jgi:peptidylprolyl isomerase
VRIDTTGNPAGKRLRSIWPCSESIVMKKLPKDILVLIVIMVVLVSAILVMTLRESADAEAAKEKPQDIPVAQQKTVKTESGLQYVDSRIGIGEPVKNGSRIKVFYTGTLKDGKRFDGNVGEEPLPVTIGFAEGLLGMQKGGKRKILIPYQLGYGDAGDPPKIPPKADLVFDLEVVEVVNR